MTRAIAPTGSRSAGALTRAETFAALRDEVAEAVPDVPSTRSLHDVRLPDRARGGDLSGAKEQFDLYCGIAVHTLVAMLAPVAHGRAPHEIADLIHENLGTATRGLLNINGRAAALRQRVAGLTAIYLRDLAPPLTATLIAAELPTMSGGRVDLGWRWPDGSVVYDELKTWRTHKPTLDASTQEQVQRYLKDGVRRHRTAFAGVRLVPVSNSRDARMFTPDGRSLLLSRTPFAFDNGRWS